MVTLVRPGSAREAQGLKDALGAAAAFAGGATALQLVWSGAPAGLTLIDVNALAESQGIGQGAGGLRIGAATRLEALRRDPRVRADAPLLAQACESLAALSVRNLATLGGNLGWRCGDTVAVLLVLDARVELADGTLLDVADWLADASAPLVVAVHVPSAPGDLQVFEKVGHRAAFSPTRLALAVCGDTQRRDWRVAVTGAGLPARRLQGAEQVLRAGDATLPMLTPACAADLADAALGRLAARLLHGHLAAAIA